MIDTELRNDGLILSYSTNGKQIKPIYDRLGKPISKNTIYEDGRAIDIIVDGKPRYDYVETDIDAIAYEQEKQDRTTERP